MFNFIRRHQSLALVFIILVCLSFVVFFSSDNVFDLVGGGGRGQYDYGSIDGRPISGEAYQQAYREAALLHLLYYGVLPRGGTGQYGYNVESQALNRIFYKRKFKELGIEPDDEAVADWIQEQFTQEGAFDREAYEGFLERIEGGGVSKADFHRFARHQVAHRHLQSLVGASGRFVSRDEAKGLYREENKKVKGEAIFFNTQDYLDKVAANPQAIARYFTNMMSRYRLPDRRTVTYVVFESTNYWFDAEEDINNQADLAEALDGLYGEQGPASFTDENGDELSAEAAKERLKADMIERKAYELARDEAIEFGGKLFDSEEASIGTLSALAAADGYLTETSEPFSRTAAPEGLEVTSPNFTRFAFALSEEEPFSPPVLDDKEIYIFEYKDVLPSSAPPFAEVQDEVTEDYRQSQARSAMRVAANNVYRALTNGLAQAKSSGDIAAENSVELVDLPAFSKSDSVVEGMDPRFDVRRAQGVVFDLEEGEVTRFTSSGDGGFLFHVVEKLPVDDAEISEKLVDFMAELGDRRLSLAAGSWAAKAFEAARVLAPGQGDEAAPDASGATN